MYVQIRSRPISIKTGSGALQTEEEEEARLKAILTQYTMEWFSTASNIKNSHPFVTKFDETIESGDRHVVHVTEENTPVLWIHHLQQVFHHILRHTPRTHHKSAVDRHYPPLPALQHHLQHRA